VSLWDCSGVLAASLTVSLIRGHPVTPRHHVWARFGCFLGCSGNLNDLNLAPGWLEFNVLGGLALSSESTWLDQATLK